MAAWTWGTWPDPLVDFGRELYVPWRMAEGEVLYRDLAYFNGPLSPTLNSWCFDLFGASLQTLVVVNLTLLAATTALVYHVVGQTCEPRTRRRSATLATAAFLALFAFAQFVRTRNYNYVCPYSHELTHGLLIGWATIAIAGRADRRGRAAATAAGLGIGLAALTKPEAFVAVACGGAAALALTSRAAGATRMEVLRRLSLAALGSLAAPFAAVARLSAEMPLGQAIDGCLGAWQMAANEQIRNLPFYQRGLGTLDVLGSLDEIAVNSCRWGLFGLLALAVLQFRTDRPRRSAAIAAALGSSLAAWLYLDGFSWPLLERALPLLVIVLACWQAGELLLTPALPLEESRLRRARRLGLVVFSLALLAKIALACRISQYGFALAAPATIVVVVALVDWLPAAASRRGLAGGNLFLLATPLLAAYVAAYLGHQALLLDRSVVLGEGRDAFAAPAYAAPIAQACEVLQSRVKPDETLAVLPEGVMLNFLANRRTSTPYVTWMPPEVLHFGESNMVAALQASPPDWVLLAPRGLGEYGLGQFGRGFADDIARWIDANYEPVQRWDNGIVVGDAEDVTRSEWRLVRRRAN